MYPWDDPLSQTAPPPGVEPGIVYPWEAPGFATTPGPAVTDEQLLAAGGAPDDTDALLRGIIGEQPLGAPPAATVPAAVPGSLDVALQGAAEPSAVEGGLAEALAPPAAASPAEPVPAYMAPEQEVAALEALPPEEQAARQAGRDVDLQQEFARRKAEGLRAGREQADRNLLRYEQASAQAAAATTALRAQAKQLGEQKIDPDRWFSSRSVGQKIAGFLGAAFGGALQPGGKNQTLDLMQQAIDRDIDAQVQDLATGRASLEQQQGLVGDLYRQLGNLLEARETARLAMLHGLDEEIGADMAQYDPRSARVQAQLAARAQVRAQIAAQDAKLAEVNWTRRKDQADIDDKAARIAQDERESKRQAWVTREGQKAQERIAQAQVAASGAGKATEAAAKLTEEQREVVREQGLAGITMKNGAPVIARSVQQATDLDTKRSAATDIATAVDRMVATYEEEGFQSDWRAGPKWQETQANYSMMLLNAAQRLYTLGALSKEDLQIAERMAGTLDPTGVRDPTPGLRQLKKLSTETVNTDMRQLRGADTLAPYDGPEWTPPKAQDVQLAEQEEARSAEDQAALRLYGYDVAGLDKAIKQRQDEAGVAGRPIPSDEVAAAAIRSEKEQLQQSIRAEEKRKENLRFGGPTGSYPWETR